MGSTAAAVFSSLLISSTSVSSDTVTELSMPSSISLVGFPSCTVKVYFKLSLNVFCMSYWHFIVFTPSIRLILSYYLPSETCCLSRVPYFYSCSWSPFRHGTLALNWFIHGLWVCLWFLSWVLTPKLKCPSLASVLTTIVKPTLLYRVCIFFPSSHECHLPASIIVCFP